MKTSRFMALLCAVLFSLSTSIVEAKEKKEHVEKSSIETITYRIDEMHCADCEKKIQNCIRFEKGLKDIDTNLKQRTITLTYDAKKTSPEKLEKRLKKSKYTPIELKPDYKHKH